jgi:hypothetical protein
MASYKLPDELPALVAASGAVATDAPLRGKMVAVLGATARDFTEKVGDLGRRVRPRALRARRVGAAGTGKLRA